MTRNAENELKEFTMDQNLTENDLKRECQEMNSRLTNKLSMKFREEIKDKPFRSILTEPII